MIELKYHKEIIQMFEPLFESWMDANDKEDFVVEFALDQGKTLSILNSEIEIGVKNGYPPEYQVKLFHKILNIANQ